MNIYLITQDETTDYDTYDSMIVVAPSMDAARLIHPDMEKDFWREHHIFWNPDEKWPNWCTTPEAAKVTYLGKSAVAVQRIILTSFNAG